MPVLPGAYALVDLETTGTDPSRDRVTEIGVVRVVDGSIVDEWQTLVDPGLPIPPEIQRLTGISNAMVRGAPRFGQVATRLRERLAGHVLVAHNARFDYGFLKAEFRRLGERFQAEVLCTVRLSRRLYPEHARHGLDALVERHRLDASGRPAGARVASFDPDQPDDDAIAAAGGRHRALGDARLIASFVATACADHGAALVDRAIAQLQKRPARPPHLPENALEDIPESPGVYVFGGATGQPLYIGKARNLRDRIRAHFYADSSSSTDAALMAETHRLEFEETAGEISALLREIELIRDRAPLYNRALRRRESAGFLHLDDHGRPGFVPLAGFDPAASTGLYGPFGSRQAARAALAELGRRHRLCDRAIGLWSGDRPCFSRQIGRCLGLCCGEESPGAHRARLIDALAPLAFPTWPFDGVYRLIERDPDSGRVSESRFDRWCPLDPGTPPGAPLAFDLELFKLLRRLLARRSAGPAGAGSGAAREPGSLPSDTDLQGQPESACAVR
ncbi:MAG: exonuclease domain-containing protein [Lautropia sp.]